MLLWANDFRAVFWVAIGAAFTLARFSEAFLILRAQQGGLPIALAPLVLIGMNVVYAAAAYPFGRLSDRMRHDRLLALGLAVLIAADVVLAGFLWDAFGADRTFIAGAVFSALALAAILFRSGAASAQA